MERVGNQLCESCEVQSDYRRESRMESVMSEGGCCSKSVMVKEEIRVNVKDEIRGWVVQCH